MFGLKLNFLSAALALPLLVAPVQRRRHTPKLTFVKNPVHKNRWTALAQKNLTEVEATSQPGALALNRNKVINKAYAELYLANPEIFKWAGLAAFASASIGEKMELLAAGNLLRVPALVVSEKAANSLNLFSSGMDLVYNMIGRGNKAIYDDIYWQHLAYQAGGLAEMVDTGRVARHFHQGRGQIAQHLGRDRSRRVVIEVIVLHLVPVYR